MDYKYPLYETFEVNTIVEIVESFKEIGDAKIALQEKNDINKPYEGITFKELYDRVNALKKILIKAELTADDKIAVISDNRIAWAISYLAVTSSGGIIIPIDKESKEQELFHVLHTSGAKAIIYAGKFQELIEDLEPKLKDLEIKINMDYEDHNEEYLSFDRLIEEGKLIVKHEGISNFRDDVKKDDIASLLYTSGTTAMPKIAPLTHFNICSNIISMIALVGIRKDDHFLSVLPMHHVYECTCGFLCPIASGCTVSFVPNLRRIAESLSETQATIMLGVPALFKAMFNRLTSKLREKSSSKIYYNLGSIVASVSKNKLSKRFFSPVHKKLSRKLRLFITGGAAMDPYISKGFQKLGFKILQGYGLTECSPILAVNRPKAFKDAAVGHIMPSCEVKIDEPNEQNIGEILAKGDSVFSGYYQDEENNKIVFKDGWFKTGDMGYFDDEGYLYIVGRSKNVIVTSNGKNVYPEELEENLNRSEFILESVVTTKSKVKGAPEHIFAIIVPDYEYFDLYCKTRKIENSEIQLNKIIEDEIKKVSDSLAEYKRIRDFQIRSEEFNKTSTKKIKRHSL